MAASDRAGADAPAWTRAASSASRTRSKAMWAVVMVYVALVDYDPRLMVACIAFTLVADLVDERLIFWLRRYVDALEARQERSR